MKKVIFVAGMILTTTQVYSQVPQYCGDNVRNMSHYADILIKETNLFGDKKIAHKALFKFERLRDEYITDCKGHEKYDKVVYNSGTIVANSKKRLKD